MDESSTAPKKRGRKKTTPPEIEPLTSDIPTGSADALSQENIIGDILYLLQNTIQSAKENPSVNNINAVVKSLNALKLAASTPGSKRGRKSKAMIARRVIAYIEKEILNIS